MNERDSLGTASGGAGSWAANLRYTTLHGLQRHAMLFTDVRGDCPNPFVGEDIDTYRFLVEGSAAIFGRKLELGDAPCSFHDEAERDVEAAEGKYSEMDLVLSLPGGRERAITTHAHWLYYRATAADVVPELVWLIEGRSIHDAFDDNGWLGNASLSHCSWELKTKPTRAWLDENLDPRNTTILIGMDWTETHRHASVHHNYAHPVDRACARPAPKKDTTTRKPCTSDAPVDDCCTTKKPCRGRRPCTNDDPCGTRLEHPWRVEMPMNDKPKLAKPQVLGLLREHGIRPPRLYSMGFAHSNCVGCVKAGQGHWLKVHEVDPVLYAYMEARETEWQQSKPNRATNTHLKQGEQVGGETVTRPLSLTELRKRAEAEKEGQLDLGLDRLDHGGCVCGTGEMPGEV